jgi:energy-coupling factor transporter ATP-binding protein EcfA2
MAGIWPYGAGRIGSPDGIQTMVVPPKPYLPIGTLRAAVSYPALPGTYSDSDIRSALVDTRLPGRVDQLDREEAWSQHLSSGEQQRLALARALLMQPDWLFLDESTSAVDESMEADLYAVMARRLPKMTVVSIGHRSAVVRLHSRHLAMQSADGHFMLRDRAEEDTAKAASPRECGREALAGRPSLILPDHREEPSPADRGRPIPGQPSRVFGFDGEEDDLGPSDQINKWHIANIGEAAVFRILPVVSYHEKMSGRNGIGLCEIRKSRECPASEGIVGNAIRQCLPPLGDIDDRACLCR